MSEANGTNSNVAKNAHFSHHPLPKCETGSEMRFCATTTFGVNEHEVNQVNKSNPKSAKKRTL